MSRFSSLSLFITLIMTCVLMSGCPGKGKPGDKGNAADEAWVKLFKTDLVHSQERFFESKYIQQKDDPFYLREVMPRVIAYLAKGANAGPIPKDLKVQIDDKVEDYKMNWSDVLVAQFTRTQMIFAVTAVLPAHNANLALTQAKEEYNLETAAMIMKFKEIVQKHTLFNGTTKQLELAPEARQETMDLANKIALKTLGTINDASKKSLSADLQKQLSTAKNVIRLLNPTAAEAAGMALDVNQEPFIEDPMKTFTNLANVYQKIFSALEEFEKLDGLRADLVKTRAGTKAHREQQALLTRFTADLMPKVEEVKALQDSEAQLLKSLLFATEKQFKTSEDLARGK